MKSTGLAIESGLWETVCMKKRYMRIVKMSGAMPDMAACTNCGHEFKVYSGKKHTIAEATENLRNQFAAHDCKEDASQAAARIVREATEEED